MKKMGQQLNQNQHRIMLILAVLAILLSILIPPGIFYDWVTQPNVVYEQLPVYKINTSEDADIKSVLAVSLKNTGKSPAKNLSLVIYSNINDAKKFYQDKNEIVPDHFKELIDVKAKPNLFRMVYTLDDFAAGSNFFICISTPYEEPEVKIKGTWGGGNEIKIEKGSSLLVLLIGLWLYSLGLSTCFLVTKFLIPRIRRKR